jgi:hypothetical protein
MVEGRRRERSIKGDLVDSRALWDGERLRNELSAGSEDVMSL